MSRKQKWAVGAVVIGSITIGLFLFINWANSPAKQVTKVSSNTNKVDVAAEPDKIASTRFFTTHIPSGFRFQTNENNANPDMLHFSAFATQGTDIQIGITTAKLQAEGIEGVADYLYRVKSNDIYERVPSTAFLSDSPSFRKKSGGTELASFLIHGDRYASVVVSSTSVDTAALETVAATLAKNWQWQ